MNKINLLWDLDGTLIDSNQEILSCLLSAIADSGISRKKIKNPLRVGPTIDKILDNAYGYGILSEKEKDIVIRKFRSRYDNSSFENTIPIPNIEQVLRNNHDFVHHIITNKPDFPVKKIMTKLGWNDFFSSIRTPYTDNINNNRCKKSKKDLFRKCMEEYCEYPCIAIGDMDNDILAAKENGIRSIGVLWGNGTKDELETAEVDFIVYSVDELLQAIDKIITGIL